MKNIKLLDEIAQEWHNTYYYLIKDAEAKEKICDEAISRALGLSNVVKSPDDEDIIAEITYDFDKRTIETKDYRE